MFLLALILVAASNQLVLLDEVVDVQAASVQAVNVNLDQSGALIEVSYDVGGEDVELVASLVGPGDGAFSARGRPNQYLRMLPPGNSGAFRFPAHRTGMYRVVLDNQANQNKPVSVNLRVAVTFGDEGVTGPVTLPPRRRAIVVSLSLLMFFAVAFFTGRKLLAARRGRPRGGQIPLF